MRRLVYPLLLVAVLSGCKTLFATESGDVTYAPDAKTNLARGQAAFASKDYAIAEKYYEYVRTKYPYSDGAKEAELKLADLSWEKEDFTDARDRYTNFVKLHPGFARVDYAAFRAAAAHYYEFKKQATEFFLFPPPYEKDQTEIKAAYQSLNDFAEGYPKSRYLADATKLLTEIKHRLAAHEMYVARFYAKRQNWNGAVGRWAGVVKDFPNLGEDQEAAFQLADAYRRHLNAPEKARDVLRLIIDRYPNTAAAERAERLLRS